MANDLIDDLPATTHKGFGDWYRKRGAFIEASAYYLIALERDPKLTIARYRLACAMSASAPETDLGLFWLEGAVEAGFWGAPALKEDEAFASHHESERYKAALATVEGRYANAVLDWKSRSVVAFPTEVPEGSTLPAMIFLHGFGDHHRSYIGRIHELKKHNFVGIAVSGTMPFCEDSLRWNQLDVESTHEAIQAAIKRHVAEGVPLDESRIYLTGFSQGALHASKLLALYPDAYRGGIALSIGGSQELVAPIDVDKKRPLFGVWGTAEHPGNIALMEEARELWGAAALPWREHTHDGQHHFPGDWETVLPEALEWLRSFE